MPRDGEFLGVFSWAGRIASFVATTDRAGLDDWRNMNALVRELEVIGEACRLMSDEFKARHPEIPWHDIVGMRNRLMHAYRDVDANIVWNAAVAMPVSPAAPGALPLAPTRGPRCRRRRRRSLWSSTSRTGSPRRIPCRCRSRDTWR